MSRVWSARGADHFGFLFSGFFSTGFFSAGFGACSGFSSGFFAGFFFAMCVPLESLDCPVSLPMDS